MSGTKEISEKAYCVYYHKNDDVVFYVGAGKSERPYVLAGRSDKWRKHVNSLPRKTFDVDIEIAAHFPSKQEALRFEREEIKRLKPIANVFDNPELILEPLLVRFTKDQRAWIRRKSKKLKLSEAALIRACIMDNMYSK